MFSKPTVKSCFLASKKMFQACGFHYSLLFSLSISKIDDNFNLDFKILILKVKPVGPSQYPHPHEPPLPKEATAIAKTVHAILSSDSGFTLT